MTLNGFVGRLFGDASTAGAPVTVDPNLFSAAAANTLFPKTAPARTEPAVVVQRDEVFDARTRICGYRFRTLPANGSGPVSPLAKVDALKADNLANFAQRRMAIVPVRVDEWRAQDFGRFVTPNTIFLVAAPLGEAAAAWRTGLEEIKASGAKVGVDGAVASSGFADALDVADAVFIRFADYSLEGFDRTLAGLRSRYPSLVIIADDVHSWLDYRMCLGLGSHYCLGSFATTPDEEDPTEMLPSSRPLLDEMLRLLRGEADLAELVAAAKRDPGIAVKLLRLANSLLPGSKSPLASIDLAIAALGRETVYRWVAAAIFRVGAGGRRDEALLEVALRRARFLELLTLGRWPKQESDELFVLGLMSLMDRLLGMPMNQVLAKMPLPQGVNEVLAASQGRYAPYVALAIAMEAGHGDRARQLAAGLDLDAAAVIDSNISARTWAEWALAAP